MYTVLRKGKALCAFPSFETAQEAIDMTWGRTNSISYEEKHHGWDAIGDKGDVVATIQHVESHEVPINLERQQEAAA